MWRLGSQHKSKDKILISGTGRAGTTFLVQLLSRLGFDTGFRFDPETNSFLPTIGATLSKHSAQYFDTARAGLEWDPREPSGPAIIKNPYICDELPALLAEGMRVKHIIIPVRRLEDAAESRRSVQLSTTGRRSGSAVAGGLWGTTDENLQEAVLANKFHNLLFAVAEYDIPFILVAFPRIVQDEDYLYRKLRLVFGRHLSRKTFRECFNETVDRSSRVLHKT